MRGSFLDGQWYDHPLKGLEEGIHLIIIGNGLPQSDGLSDRPLVEDSVGSSQTDHLRIDCSHLNREDESIGSLDILEHTSKISISSNLSFSVSSGSTGDLIEEGIQASGVGLQHLAHRFLSDADQVVILSCDIATISGNHHDHSLILAQLPLNVDRVHVEVVSLITGTRSHQNGGNQDGDSILEILRFVDSLERAVEISLDCSVVENVQIDRRGREGGGRGGRLRGRRIGCDLSQAGQEKSEKEQDCMGVFHIFIVIGQLKSAHKPSYSPSIPIKD